jgi:pyruvate kinase
MRRQRNAKIIATLGPASSSSEMIRKLFNAGADVFRLNFSHGSHGDHKARLDIIRDLERETGRPIAILLDLQGPKLRLGTFREGKVNLTAGQAIRLDLATDPGDDKRASLPHPEIFAALKPQTNLLLDDGKVRLRVERCGPDFADTVVVTGGAISDRKGVNVPDAVLPLSPLTDKDRKDLAFGLELGVDWIALSFVQRPEDVAEAREIIGGRAKVLSKLEKPAAVERLEDIVALSDAIMVARGDLGVELPPEDVPGIQRRMVRVCRQAGKPVVVATQMLESMINTPTPTRAEASDVATAVFDGVDAVMLSAESASGSYPVEAVTMMDRIICKVERDPQYRKIIHAEPTEPEATSADAISSAVRKVTGILPVTATVAYTTSGSTSLRIARERPEAPILSLTPNLATARRLALVWGVHSVHTEDAKDAEDMVAKASRIALDEGFAESGRPLVIIAGMPFGTPGSTNLLRITWAG